MIVLDSSVENNDDQCLHLINIFIPEIIIFWERILGNAKNKIAVLQLQIIVLGLCFIRDFTFLQKELVVLKNVSNSQRKRTKGFKWR